MVPDKPPAQHCPAQSATHRATLTPPRPVMPATDSSMSLDDVADVLLTGLVEQTGRCTNTMVTVTRSRPGPNAVLEAAALLRSRGHVRVLETFGAMALHLTYEGLRAADRIVRERANHGVRMGFILDRLVAAAYAEPASSVDLQAFTARTLHRGERLDASAVATAALDLRAYGLAILDPGDSRRPRQLTLTAAGRHCAATQPKVIQYMTRHTAASGPVFHQHIQPGATGTQAMNVTHHHGTQPADLSQLLEQLRAVAGLTDDRDRYRADLDTVQDTHAPAETRHNALARMRSLLEAAGAASSIIQATLALGMLI
ncbi:hypothetical protein AB0F11_14195 [Streptomyces sp. NPDC032472]|uniref:hypothetical protein n=1 Tax=Streptomyces sp. NPDC032472 TaxID=3155018 RepID=UPI0033CC3FFC